MKKTTTITLKKYILLLLGQFWKSIINSIFIDNAFIDNLIISDFIYLSFDSVIY